MHAILIVCPTFYQEKVGENKILDIMVIGRYKFTRRILNAKEWVTQNRNKAPCSILDLVNK